MANNNIVSPTDRRSANAFVVVTDFENQLRRALEIIFLCPQLCAHIPTRF